MMKEIVATVGLFCAFQCGVQKYCGPQCLGPFCIDRLRPISRLFKQIGPPTRKTAPYCYASRESRAFLYVQTDDSAPASAVEIFLSDFRSCLHSPARVTTDDLYAWKTREGIGLGSLEKDVLKAYGKPSKERKIDTKNPQVIREIIHDYRLGDKTPQTRTISKSLYYAGDMYTDLSRAQFGICGDRVCWILLSMSE